MTKYIVKRLLLSLVTLWLLVTIVFVIVAVLPGNVGRTILGNTAPEQAVLDFNERWGLNDPLLTRYARLVKGLFTFDFGESWKTSSSVWDLLSGPLFRSAKLAVLALAITTPISIAAGTFAARHRDTWIDRTIVLTGLATSSIPEYVTGVILAVVVGVQLEWLPVVATIPDGTPFLQQFRYLWLPAISMAIVYFGYIARMMRAGTIRALDADYTRTATMRGLSDAAVMRKHVLRNALAPTITVVSVQIGYLFGGIIAVETVFNYAGLGQALLNAARTKDLPVLQVAVTIVAIVYMVATLVADVIIAWLNPRVRQELGAG